MTAFEQFKKDVAGKQVTLMGLGVLGRGVGDAAFLSECGAHVLVTDTKRETQLAESLARLKGYPNITYHLGGHREDDFTRCHLVIKAAGVRLDSPYIRAARDAGVPVYMSTALFAKYAGAAGARLVGITGTRGKSTVSHFIYHTLVRAGKRALLGGNIRGLSTLPLLSDVRDGDIAVLELDSWQLQGFGDLMISPHIAVFTNLMPDHQNYYADMEAYFADKAQIFRHQRQGDALLIGSEIEARVRAAHPPVEPDIVGDLASDWTVNIPGEHMRKNAAFAAAALLRLGLNTREIRDGIESFEGVEGRLQYMGVIGGVKVYNDNNATTPEATVAALSALGTPDKHIVLIAGGSDKALPLEKLAHAIATYCKKTLLIPGSGTDRLAAMVDADMQPSLEAALEAAFEAAEFGDIVLFSPAFASFGAFTNEYDRNDQFVEIVGKRMNAQ